MAVHEPPRYSPASRWGTTRPPFAGVGVYDVAGPRALLTKIPYCASGLPASQYVLVAER
jgi:hypothetical protein